MNPCVRGKVCPRRKLTDNRGRLRPLSTTLIALLFAWAPLDADAASQKCAKFSKSKPFVYAIGSSTLGSYLGSFLKRDLPKAGFEFRKWAKASSGLARPDFHDWLDRVPEIAKQWKPDVFVVSLGTNDFQRLRKGRKWIKVDTPAWKAEYEARVDKMLKLAAGPKKKRVVVWVGPGIFDQPKARRMAQLINSIVKDRIAKFEGTAFHIDVVNALLQGKKRPRKKLKTTRRKFVTVYGKDKIHMTREAIQHLMSNPVVRVLKDCKNGKTVITSR